MESEGLRKLIKKYSPKDVIFTEHFYDAMNHRLYFNEEDVRHKIFELEKLRLFEDQSDKYKEPRFLLLYKISSQYDFAIVARINGGIRVITAFKRTIKPSDYNRKNASFFVYKKEGTS